MEQITFDKTKIKVVPIDQVVPNTWNPKEKKADEYEGVLKSIEINGIRQPIVVRRAKNSEQYEIIDGEQRYTACLDLDFKNIPIYDEGDMSDIEAKKLTVWYQQQVPFNGVQEAHLITAMYNEIQESGLEFDLPYDDADLSRMINMVEFDWSDYEMEVEEGEKENATTSEGENYNSIRVTLKPEQFKQIKEYIDAKNKKKFLDNLMEVISNG